MKGFLAASTIVILASSSAFGGVTWDEQAERLQNISATLLDGIPFAEPIIKPRGVEGHAAISFLPKTNPTVGGKSEDVPSSPVHMVPTFQFGHRPAGILSGNLGYKLWAGYLPAGGEKLVNINAKLSQYLVGSSLSYTFPMGQSLSIHVPVGAQVSSATVRGAITAKDSNDSFDTSTMAFYLAPGLSLPLESLLGKGGVAWSSLLLGSKTTSSEFQIPADDTDFNLKDNRMMVQLASGVQLESGIQVGAGLLYVPERLMMPRLRLGYHYAF